MDDDPPTAECPPADAWELPRRPRSRVDDWLLLAATLAALGILGAADVLGRARDALGRAWCAARWRIGGLLLDTGIRILPPLEVEPDWDELEARTLRAIRGYPERET